MTSLKKSPWSFLKEGLFFICHFIKAPSLVGAILPSSNQLAKAMVRHIPIHYSTNKRYILEVGPGTGIFTEQIIKRMNPTDELHLVESDPDFCEELRTKFAHLPNVKIFEGSIIDFNPLTHMNMSMQTYDFIISGLPFNSFEESFVNEVLRKYQNLAKNGGSVSYFEYLFLPTLTKLFMENLKANNLNQILKLKKEFYKKFGQDKEKIWLNMPPAQVLNHIIKK